MYDGHVHTPYCPHGSSASFIDYVDTLRRQGFQGATFCEHAPLPHSFVDPTPEQDSGMSLAQLPHYLEDLQHMKKEYEHHFTINIGLEVDFIEGYEEETKELLDEYGPKLDDAILSVHFVKTKDYYHCIDFSEQAFQLFYEQAGSIEQGIRRYYETVIQSIHANLGRFKPTRIGHPSLVRKFQREFALPNDETWLLQVLQRIKANNYAIDTNGAGTIKPKCLEPYPPLFILNEATKQRIPLVYGSDAHHPTGIAQGYDTLRTFPLSSPTRY
ncbi:hypothetical protein DH09_01875 [Bacillaceae bacterium JMAK1]|nr:hypothetical protein DH09_01875 [Bacillaceae bacterium JMAK1]